MERNLTLREFVAELQRLDKKKWSREEGKKMAKKFLTIKITPKSIS